MKRLEPDFIKEFHCIASACQDTCCAGWEIELDEETADYYRQVRGAFGERLREQMQTEEDETYFALTKEKRCPFLNEQNLCELYMELGEDALCDICTEHPRFYNWFGDYTEQGLGLCCEEAERLLFAHPEPVRFVLREEGEEPQEEEDEWIPQLLAIRERAFAILQDRPQPIWERLVRCRSFFAEMQRRFGEPAESGTLLREKMSAECISQARTLLSFYEGLECLDERWPRLLQAARERLPEICAVGFMRLDARKEREYEWEHLAVYFLYRYLMEAVYDGDMLLRMDFVLASLSVLRILAAQAEATEPEGYTEARRDELVRMYSREIEYCPENMEAIYEALRSAKIVPFWTE